MLRNDRIFCFEALDVTDPLFHAAERLYVATQHPDERIPWGWIARSLKGRVGWRPGMWGNHLLIAMPEEHATNPDELAGFAYGAHLPAYGGYISYLGVAEAYRRRGVGTRLFNQMFKLLAADAGAIDEPLPFVMWESKRPTAHAPEADWKLWEARLKLFDRTGALWVDGLELHTPNYSDSSDQPVPLQLFVKPIDTPATKFTGEMLTGIATGLLDRVYRMQPEEVANSTHHRHEPQLRPCKEANRKSERQLVGV